MVSPKFENPTFKRKWPPSVLCARIFKNLSSRHTRGYFHTNLTHRACIGKYLEQFGTFPFCHTLKSERFWFGPMAQPTHPRSTTKVCEQEVLDFGIPKNIHVYISLVMPSSFTSSKTAVFCISVTRNLLFSIFHTHLMCICISRRHA